MDMKDPSLVNDHPKGEKVEENNTPSVMAAAQMVDSNNAANKSPATSPNTDTTDTSSPSTPPQQQQQSSKRQVTLPWTNKRSNTLTTTTNEPTSRGVPTLSKLFRSFSTNGNASSSTTSPTSPPTNPTSPPSSSSSPTQKFTPHPTWNLSTTMTIRLLRQTLLLHKDNVSRARSLTELGSVPVPPLSVKIQKVYIPRRKDCVIERGLMKEEDFEGFVKAEWVDYVGKGSVGSGSSGVDGNDEDESQRRVVLYLHGGAYFICNRKTHRSITWRLSKQCKARLLVIDYRLSPEHLFPCALHDAISSYLYLLNPTLSTTTTSPTSPSQQQQQQIYHKPYKPSQIVVMGDSAGGGLATAMMIWLRDYFTPGSGIDRVNGLSGIPAGFGLMSPWLDLTHSMASFKLNGGFDYLPLKSHDPKYIHRDRDHYYVADNSLLTHPLVSPFYSKPTPNSPPLPPVLIQCGDVERLRDEIIHFVAVNYGSSPASAPNLKLEIYEGMVHVFQMFAGLLGVSDFALARLGEFCLTVTNKDKEGKGGVSWDTGYSFVRAQKGYQNVVLKREDLVRVLEVTKECVRNGGGNKTAGEGGVVAVGCLDVIRNGGGSREVVALENDVVVEDEDGVGDDDDRFEAIRVDEALEVDGQGEILLSKLEGEGDDDGAGFVMVQEPKKIED
ncbi:hypothetical protein HDU76_010219 [Blyttiomyces sp. JEL0837]|nr:hypothetical protein HDU76_010219 [Blyttiomyces sp. JEL0837]